MENKPDPVGALELLDYDCWRVVMRNLNAEDLLNCRRICRPFNLLLEEMQFETKWKFHLILPQLFNYLESFEEPYSGEYSWKTLHCVRLTCKSWQQSTDKYMSDVYTQIGIAPVMKDIPLVACFDTPEKIGKFQQKFGGSSRNPFPSRTVYFSIASSLIEELEDQEDVKRMQTAFMEKVGDFLEQFGRNIFKLEVFLELEYDACSLPLGELIKRITVHVPNLKTFFIGCDYNDQIEDERDEVATFIEENALAELPKLQTLRLGKMANRLESYLLDKYASQLTEFEKVCNDNDIDQVQAQKFKNVREVKLTIQEPDTLEVLRFLASPLKLLQLFVLPFRRDEHRSWNVDELLRNLKHLPLNCLRIELFMANVTEAGLPIEEYINESIQSLDMSVRMGSKITFNFLEALTKLGSLSLEFTGPITKEQDVPEVVKLLDYVTVEAERMDIMPYLSNVWEKVPSLKRLRVSQAKYLDRTEFKGVYTREKYEEVKRFRRNLSM